MPLNTIHVQKLYVYCCISAYTQILWQANIYYHRDCLWQRYYKAETWQQERDKQILFIALKEIILQQANNTNNIYYCVLEMCAIFTVMLDETSAVALRSCLSLTVKDSHRAGSLLLAACEPTKVHYSGKTQICITVW